MPEVLLHEAVPCAPSGSPSDANRRGLRPVIDRVPSIRLSEPVARTLDLMHRTRGLRLPAGDR